MLNVFGDWSAITMENLYLEWRIDARRAADCGLETDPAERNHRLAIPVGNTRPNSANDSPLIRCPIPSRIPSPFRLVIGLAKPSPFVPNLHPHHECEINDKHPLRATIE